MSALSRAELRQLALTKVRHALTEDQWDDIMRLLIRGASITEVAGKYGIGKSTIVRRRTEYLARLNQEETE